MKSMKISIVTVCYNAEKTIEKTMKSVLEQTYKDIEYIIIDGKSKDNTLKIIETYKMEKIKIISEKDTGIYNAMNKALQIANGEYIYYLNAGDVFLNKNTLKEVVEKISLKKKDIYYGNILDEYSNTYIKKMPINKYFFIRGKTICHQAMFIKTSKIKEYRFDEEYNISADKDLLVRMYKDKNKINYIDINICFYDRTGISSSKQNKDKLSYENKKIIVRNFPINGRIFYLIKTIKNYIKE